jgi:glycosyltransferase involved in cell wall biosynthesis
MRKIILTLDSAQMGGIETHVLTLAIYLSDKGYDVAVWFFKEYPGHPLYQALAQHNIDYLFCGSTVGYWWQLNRNRQDIILHTHGYKAGIVGRVFAKIFRIPVLSTYHSGDVGTGKLRFYSYLDRLTARFGDRIAVSELIKETLPPDTQMIPNFISMTTRNRVYPAQKATSTKPLRVAFVGRLSVEKGPDQFCQLAAMWHSEKPIEFVVYGDGPEREQLAAEYQSCVEFKGHVNMKDHWQSVDVLCISSRYEGLPYAALEAMALGIPVVSFEVGGIGDLISDPSLGWLVYPGDVAQLKLALCSWYELSAERKANLSNNIREKILHHYSTAALVPSIEAIYQRY